MFEASYKFARIRIVATCYALVFVASAASGGITSKTVLSLLLIIAVTIHANSINDYTDKEIDKINLGKAGDRPLVSGDISSRQFWLIHYSSGLLSLLLSLFYGLDAFFLTVGLMAVDYAYSLKPFRIVNRTFASPILLSVAYVFYPMAIGYWAVSPKDDFPWLLSIGLFIGFVARLLLKDFRDIKGDKKFGKITFLIRYGSRKTCLASGLLWLLALVIVAAASDFSAGVVIVLALGFLQAYRHLGRLAESSDLKSQESLIASIAKSANIIIITLLAYFLCLGQAGISNLQSQLIPATLGSVLLVSNFARFRGV